MNIWFYLAVKLFKSGWGKAGGGKGKMLLLLVAFFISGHSSRAQTDTVGRGEKEGAADKMFSLGVGVQHGFIFPHSQEVQNTKGARPTGLEVVLSWQSNDAPTWALCNCFPRQGLLLNYYNFDNRILGRGASVAYFLEPTYRITPGGFFSFKGAAGLSYLTNPFDSIRNPGNQSYSTTISAYLLFGVGGWVRLGKQWWLNPSVNYQHISNGGMKKPNKGINWPTAGLALSYQPATRPYYQGTRPSEKFWQNYVPWFELGAFGTSRRGYDKNRNRIRSPLVGLSLQAAKQVGRLSALTLGTEISRDEELRNELNKASVAASPVKAGVLAGHAFILGKFLFSQRLGYYVFDQTPFFDQLYHRWGLQYRLNQRFSTEVNLLAHRQVAEYIDFRLTYSWQRPPR